MEQQIISYYTDGHSIEKTALHFKIGKIKVKNILCKNNIPLRKRGGQVKNYDKNPVDLTDKWLKCKKTGEVLTDTLNTSGAVIKHIKKTYKGIELPSAYKRRVYEKKTGHPFYLDYFYIIPKEEKPTIKCGLCDWKTYDINNNTGALTKHIENEHNLTITEYVNKCSDHKHLFSKITKNEELEIIHSDETKHVKCQVCDEKYKTITNTHLSTHNMTLDDYIVKYGDHIVSDELKIKYTNQLKYVDTSIFYRSNEEKELEEFIKSLGVNYIASDKKTLNGVELDILLPDHNIAIEYNGLYWHSEKNGKDKNYHLDKTKMCLKKGIRLIHIFSDEWLSKKDIIKNRLRNLLGKNEGINEGINEGKIYARKCEIRSITQKEKSDFLNENHLQGNDKSSIYYGLYYGDQLVSVITFGKKRGSLGSVSELGVYELYRFASKNVVGGFSKLLNYFIKNHKPKQIITYADRSWSPSDDFCFYGKVGFTYDGVSKPNYYYMRNYSKRLHRYSFRKDVLVKEGYDKNKSEGQIMTELGYDKIWDVGNLRYVYFL